MKPETMMIDDVKYIREDKAINIEFEEGDTITSFAIGKFVIVRSRNEGVNAGTVVRADSTGIVLSNSRRLWHHKPKDKGLKWYEGVAQSGLSSDSKVSGTVPVKVIVEDYSMTFCTDVSKESILSQEING